MELLFNVIVLLTKHSMRLRKSFQYALNYLVLVLCKKYVIFSGFFAILLRLLW